MSAILACLVIAISDGDTLTCLTDDKQQHKIRLAEIDAPEKRQPFGTRSRQSLGELCHEKRADVRVTDRDRYATDKSLYRLQDEARAAGRGLWADKDPMAPWEWRDKAKMLTFPATK